MMAGILPSAGKTFRDRGFLYIPAKRFNPGFPLPLLSGFLDHMHVGEVQIEGGGAEALMAEDLLKGGQRDDFLQCHRGERMP